MESQHLSLLIVVLLFFISLLLNLIQRRHSKTRLNRMIKKDESFLTSLAEIHHSLGELERNCTFEVYGENSPQKTGKALHLARDKIESIIDHMREHLRSFPQYRKKERAQEEKKKKRNRLRPKTSRK